MILELTKENFYLVEQSAKPVVIDAYATWCGPCQLVKPIFEELEKELGDTYLFAEINVDDAFELAVKFGITSVPTFVFIKDGKIQGKEVGYMSKEDMKEKIKELLG